MNTETKARPLSGHSAMDAWDKTWIMHHLTMWARKVIRRNAIRNGTWVPAGRFGQTTPDSLLPDLLFDHWGSVRRGGIRALVTQPYGNHDESALVFAKQMGCTLKSRTPGPWHEGTWYYEFLPNGGLP